MSACFLPRLFLESFSEYRAWFSDPAQKVLAFFLGAPVNNGVDALVKDHVVPVVRALDNAPCQVVQWFQVNGAYITGFVVLTHKNPFLNSVRIIGMLGVRAQAVKPYYLN